MAVLIAGATWAVMVASGTSGRSAVETFPACKALIALQMRYEFYFLK